MWRRVAGDERRIPTARRIRAPPKARPAAVHRALQRAGPAMVVVSFDHVLRVVYALIGGGPDAVSGSRAGRRHIQRTPVDRRPQRYDRPLPIRRCVSQADRAS